jgi:hypothetical protein
VLIILETRSYHGEIRERISPYTIKKKKTKTPVPDVHKKKKKKISIPNIHENENSLSF